MKQWSRVELIQHRESLGFGALTFGWANETGGTMVAVSQPADEDEARSLQTRVILHWLVDLMPDAALGNVLEDTLGAWEDYQISLRPALPAPATTKRVTARIRRRFERPAFEIVEE